MAQNDSGPGAGTGSGPRPRGHGASSPGARDADRRGGPARGGREEPLITRRDLGSWIEGPGGGESGGRWPGDLLGLPQTGPTSLATAVRRMGALLIDWALSLLVSQLAFGGDAIATLLVFAGIHVVGLTLLATTPGKAICRTQVVRLGGGGTAPVHRVLVRTALLCLVLPAIVVGPDGRGMHDRAAGTVELRM